MSAVTVRGPIVREIKRRLEAEGFFVSRKLISLAEIREDQLPGISLLNGLQSDEPIGGNTYQATWLFTLIVYEKDQAGEDPQGKIDESMALVVRSLLDGDTLGGLAVEITAYTRNTDNGLHYPFASAEMVFNIKFLFDQETQGG
jgi:hypothetical protein